ncbi:squalene/phytoene synthase family protein [Candidatus Neomarinimicrobiota bacterium]
MTVSTDILANEITRASSKQTYYTARFWVDNDLVDDFFRAYAYCRWVDDIIDISSTSDRERKTFMDRQQEIISRCYRNEPVEALLPEEQMVVDLIHNDRFENSGLQSFIRNVLTIIEFDAKRKGRLISQEELIWYTDCLGRGVIDGLQYFIGNGHPYPESSNQYLAAIAAHIIHLLRDTVQDTADGFINVPREYLELHKLNPADITHPLYIAWVEDRIKLARDYFVRGKQYINSLKVLRCRIVGLWYCSRFENVLNQIERNRFILRENFDANKVRSLTKLGWLAIMTPLLHLFSTDSGRIE